MTDPTPTTPGIDPQPDDECARCPHVRAVHDGPCNAHIPSQTTDAPTSICPCPAFTPGPWVDITGHVLAIERLQVLDLRPGDIIIGTLPPGCTTALASAIVTDLERRFPHHDRVILPAGVGLHLVRPAPGPVVNVHQHIEGDPQRAGDFLRDKGWRLDAGGDLTTAPYVHPATHRPGDGTEATTDPIHIDQAGYVTVTVGDRQRRVWLEPGDYTATLTRRGDAVLTRQPQELPDADWPR